MGSAPSAHANGREVQLCCDCTSNADGERASLMPKGGGRQGEGEPVQESRSIVQFGTLMYYCHEAEGKVQVDVVRLGDADGPASFDYATQDGSAKANARYVAASGTAMFKSGETTKTITIDIIESDSWDATLDFEVILTRVRRAHMGMYLNRCRVSIVDSNAFPTDRFREQLTSNDFVNIPGSELMLEFVKMNLEQPNVLVGTLKTIFVDQMKSLYFLLTLYLQLYLVDVVLQPAGFEGEDEIAERRLLFKCISHGSRLLSRLLEGDKGEEEMESEGTLLIPGSRRDTAIIVGLLYVAPFLALHFIEIWKLSLGVSASSRRGLMENLLRKFLNYKEEVRANISTGDLTMAMTRDITEVIDGGYMKILEVIRVIGKICIALVFILAENKMAAVPLVIFPFVMLIYLSCREERTVEANEAVARSENGLVHKVNSAIANYKLIADFFLRPFVLSTYSQHVKNYNAYRISASIVRANNVFLAPFLTTVLVGTYMVYGTFQVESLGGTLSLGTFLGTVNVFKELGLELQEVYGELNEVQKAVGPLRQICFFMNQATDLEQRMVQRRDRQRVGEERRQTARSRAESDKQSAEVPSAAAAAGQGGGPPPPVVFAVDTIAIEVVGLRFEYTSAAGPYRLHVSARFAQGKLYAVVGERGRGKATLLKILGQVLMPPPGRGAVFVPPHLRVCHVHRGSGILDDQPLLTNVVLNQELSQVGGLGRVERLCRLAGFSEKLVLLLRDDDPPVRRSGPPEKGSVCSPRSAWAARFSSSDFARLSLARALVLNPELLVMHMPLIDFSEAETRRLTRLLREHVDHGGLGLEDDGPPLGSRAWRRPRTVFFSSTDPGSCLGASMIYEVASSNDATSFLRPLCPQAEGKRS